MSNIVIDIAAEFTGKKAFTKAEKSTAALAKGAGKLAGALGVAFSTKAIVQYVKAASMAAAQDQQAQAVLSNNLKNLGLAYASVDSEKFIASLEKQTSILDDELRPAYSQLARVTSSIATTQKLMRVAFDASKGSGLSYASTIDILSQAYVGNKKGLKQLNLGFSTTELAAMSFDDVLTIITNRFNGAGKEALKGYAGQMAALNVATSNSAETIGGAFLDAFAKLAGGGSIDKATSKIDTFSKTVADLIRLLTGVNSLSAAMDGVDFRFGFIPTDKKKKPLVAGQSPGDRAAIEKANAKAIKDARALALLAKQSAAAELAKLKAKKDQAALDKAKLALEKGTDIFNLEAIQLNAAMINTTQQLGKVTSQAQLLALTNDLARLRVKQDILDLEDAIARGDAVAATAAAKKLNTDLAILGTLNNQAIKLADIKGILAQIAPKSLIDITNLNEAIRKIIEMNALLGTKTITSPNLPNPIITLPPTISKPDFPTMPKGEEWDGFINLLPDSADTSTTTAAPIVITFNAPIYTVDSAEFAANVQKAIQNNNRFGNNLSYAGGLGN